MSSPVRLIALDLDGTTLTSQREVHPENILAVKRAQAAGITVVLASGRISTSMDKFAEQLGTIYPRVCANGGHVVGEGRTEIGHWPLDPRVARIVWEYAEEKDIHLNAYARFDLMFLRETEWSSLYHERLGFKLGRVVDREEALTTELTKMMLVVPPQDVASHRKAMEDLLQGLPLAITESEPEYLEFLPEGVSKATGLAELANSLGIQQGETAAIGDYLNDLEMLNWVGYSGAVANAAEQVRESVDYVGPSNDQAGVARFIDWVLDNAGQ